MSILFFTNKIDAASPWLTESTRIHIPSPTLLVFTAHVDNGHPTNRSRTMSFLLRRTISFLRRKPRSGLRKSLPRTRINAYIFHNQIPRNPSIFPLSQLRKSSPIQMKALRRDYSWSGTNQNITRQPAKEILFESIFDGRQLLRWIVSPALRRSYCRTNKFRHR